MSSVEMNDVIQAIDARTERYGSWRQFLAITITYTTFMIPGVIGASAYMVGSHADNPKHAGAVSRDEFTHFVADQNRLKDGVEKLNDKVDAARETLNEKLDRLLIQNAKRP